MKRTHYHGKDRYGTIFVLESTDGVLMQKIRWYHGHEEALKAIPDDFESGMAEVPEVCRPSGSPRKDGLRLIQGEESDVTCAWCGLLVD